MDDSDDPERTEDPETQIKVPFRFINKALNRIIDELLPFYLENLKKQCENINTFKDQRQWQKMQSEQVAACLTVKSLESVLYELQSLSHQVKEEDRVLFQERVEGPTQDAADSIAHFLELNSNVMQPLPKFSHESINAPQSEVPLLVCDLQEPALEENSIPGPSQEEKEQLKELTKIEKHWGRLKSQFVELNELFKRFGSLVFMQRENVDSIEDHIRHTRENVEEGEKQLRKAVILRSATVFPLVGAVIGGLTLGPIGALVGLKVCAAGALSGSVLGFGAGWRYKKQRQEKFSIEMKALTASSKSQCFSAPDLQQLSEISSLDGSCETESVRQKSD